MQMLEEEGTENYKADITCKPIDTFEEVLGYMDRPPGWAARCRKYQPKGARLLRNFDLHGSVSAETGRFFCHYESETAAVERFDEGSLPKTLICHDMANGYHDDSYIDGTPNSDAYHFYDWAAVDIFCYFSHHFITIPPLAWINAAHLHDVKVIGTIITEWRDGEAIWEKILASSEVYKRFADSVVAITKYLKFEGWLLNVENKISQPGALLEFVSYLREQLHLEVPGAVLVWYDSVTIKGDLAWQNGLNKHNIDFFRACDGIFTNYSWHERDVASSATLATNENRLRDVFIGIDVWGRNFYGGGHFNTVEAVKVAFKHGCSLAIFAPAWTYEAIDESERYAAPGVASGERMTKYEQFLLREKALWDSLWPYLNCRIPGQLPFRTSFCRGRGSKKMRNGEVVVCDAPVPGQHHRPEDVEKVDDIAPYTTVETNEPWHNMKEIDYQTNTIHGPHGYRLIKIENTISPTTSTPVSTDKTVSEEINDEEVDSKTYKDPAEAGVASKAILKSLDSERKGKLSKFFDNFIKSKFYRKKKSSEIQEVRAPIMHDSEDGENSTRKVINVQFDSVADCGDPITNDKLDTDTKATEIPIVNHENTSAPSNRKPDVVRYKLALIPGETPCLDYYNLDAFNGGSSLIIQPSERDNSLNCKDQTIRLFHCEFSCKDKLIAYVVTKTTEFCENQSLNIICATVIDATKEKYDIVLVGQDDVSRVCNAKAPDKEYWEFPAKSNQLKEVQKYLLIERPGIYVPIENINNWKVRYFVLEKPGCTITSISCRTALPRGSILLGQIGFCPM